MTTSIHSTMLYHNEQKKVKMFESRERSKTSQMPIKSGDACVCDRNRPGGGQISEVKALATVSLEERCHCQNSEGVY